jgi:hypothetical protein
MNFRTIIATVLSLLPGLWALASAPPAFPPFERLPNANHLTFARSILDPEHPDHPPSVNRESLCALLSIEDGSDEKEHWFMLLSFSNDAPQAIHSEPVTFHSSTGRSFEFGRQSAYMEIGMYGPISTSSGKATPVREEKILVNRSTLNLGLQHTAAFFEGLARIRKQMPDAPQMHYQAGNNPIAPDPILADPAVQAQFEISYEAEKAFMGSIPAILEFFELIQKTEGLNHLLRKLIPKSSTLGMLNPFATRSIGFSFGQPPPFRIPEWDQTHSVLPVVFSMGEKPVLQISLFAVEPACALECSAGVMAMEVKQTKNPERRILMRCMPVQELKALIQP